MRRYCTIPQPVALKLSRPGDEKVVRGGGGLQRGKRICSSRLVALLGALNLLASPVLASHGTETDSKEEVLIEANPETSKTAPRPGLGFSLSFEQLWEFWRDKMQNRLALSHPVIRPPFAGDNTEEEVTELWHVLGLEGEVRDLPPLLDEIRDATCDSIWRKQRPYLISGLVLGSISLAGILGLTGWTCWSIKKASQSAIAA